jgi:hypothetical protein
VGGVGDKTGSIIPGLSVTGRGGRKTVPTSVSPSQEGPGPTATGCDSWPAIAGFSHPDAIVEDPPTS